LFPAVPRSHDDDHTGYQSTHIGLIYNQGDDPHKAIPPAASLAGGAALLVDRVLVGWLRILRLGGNMRAESLIEAIDGVSRLVVLSPHLDDAVLSCGALMNHARKDMPVTVVTFFTEGGAPPYTLSARCYLRQTRAYDANKLYLARRAEDQAVLEGAAIGYLHAGLTEALFRRRTGPLLNRLPWAGRLVPELSHIYPTYRLHIIRGHISPHDINTLRYILDTIDQLSLQSSTLFLAPLAVGGHVDHMLVRTAAELSQKRVAYYSDFPYNMRYRTDPYFSQRNTLAQATWSHEITTKLALIRAYRTQVDALFPGGEIPAVPEVYMLPDPVDP
jgi:LmbE family N-acetylglucosaminyl deacetylase